MKRVALRWFIVFVGSVPMLGAATAQTAESYQTGQKLVGTFSLGKDGLFGSTVRHIPLPPGEWVVLHSESNTSVLQMARVFLAKHSSGRISELLLVASNTSRGSSVRYPDLCTSNDMTYQNRFDSSTWDQRCLEVRHDSGVLAQKQGSGNKVKDGAVSLGLSAEPVMLWMTYVQYDQKGNLLRYEYLVDPGKYEIDTAPADYQESPWHKSKLDSDPRRSAFVKQFVAYSEVLAERLQVTFQFKPPGTDPIPAFAFKE